MTTQQTDPELSRLIEDYLSLWQEQWLQLIKSWDMQAFPAGYASLSTAIPKNFNPFQAGLSKRQNSQVLQSYMGMVHALWGSAQMGLKSFCDEQFSFQSEQARDVRQEILSKDFEEFSRALTVHVVNNSIEVYEGLMAYLNHPYERTDTPRPTVWSEAPAKVLDYGGQGAPTLFIPSLINKSYIFDLKPGKSMLDYLSKQGCRPFLLDWGQPGEREVSFGLDDYILKIILPAIDALSKDHGKVNVVGYCMGGNMALAAAQLSKHVDKLALIATPWDFSKLSFAQPDLSGASAGISPMFEHLPGEVLQSFFLQQNPQDKLKKFINFSKLKPESKTAEDFVALEDWVNDGVAMSYKVAQQCYDDWFTANKPVIDQWKVGEDTIRPGDRMEKTAVFMGMQDGMVSPESVAALFGQFANAELYRVPLGHTGLIISDKARELVWASLAKFLA